jgi:steroid delta-isomerase-like uncharacterized protein
MFTASISAGISTFVVYLYAYSLGVIGENIMSEQENIRIVQRIMENLNKHDLKSSDQYSADNMISTAPGMAQKLNREQGRMYTQRFLDAFPDLKFDIKDIVAQGDKVVVIWLAKGTHTKSLTTPTGSTIPPSGREAMVPGTTYFELKNNLVTRQEVYWDQLAFLSQIGVPVEELLRSASR